MVAVRMMKATINQIVNMVAVWHGGMAAFGAVNMFRCAFVGRKSGCAFIRIGGINGNRVLVHVIVVRMMKMAVVKIVNVFFMPHRDVPASGAVDVSMIRMCCTGMFVHNFFRFLCLSLRSLQNNHRIPSLSWQEMILQVTCI
jgi:hypothetical protein